MNTIDGVVIAGTSVRSGVNVVVQQGATISGVVNGPAGPVEGAVVIAVTVDGVGSSAITSDTGAYKIDALPSGTFTVSVHADGLVRDEVTEVRVMHAQDIAGVNFNLVTAGSISGRVTQVGDGSAASFAVIIAEGNGETFSTQADDQGNYTLERVPAGAYTVRTAGLNFMTAETTANVVAGSVAMANISTGPLGAVSGVVTNASSGSPLNNVVVYVRQDGELVDSVVTDATGTYRIDGLDAGAASIFLGDIVTPGIASADVTLTPIGTDSHTEPFDGGFRHLVGHRS